MENPEINAANRKKGTNQSPDTLATYENWNETHKLVEYLWYLYPAYNGWKYFQARE